MKRPIASLLAFSLVLPAAGLRAESPPASADLVSFDFVVEGQTRRVTVQLDAAAAPQTVANFKKLVADKFYDGLAIHRAIPGYLIQLGDPLSRDESQKSAWGTGGPGYTVPAEIKRKHARGCLATARLPDSRNPSRASNGSQFYIALGDLSQLDGQYTVFGEVVRGLEHLDFIADRTTDTNDVPLQRIKVASAVLGTGGSPSQVGAIAQGAQSAVAAASGSLRQVGATVTEGGVLPKIDVPKVPLPKVPFLGKDKAAPPAPAEPSAQAVPVETQEVVLEEAGPEAPDRPKRGRRLPDLPMPSLPKLPRLNREEAPPAPAPADPSAAVPPPGLSPVTARTAMLPPEPVPAPTPPSTPPSAPAAPSSPQAPVIVTEGDRQAVSVPVPEPEGPPAKRKGFFSRTLQRVW
jgi:cyclophilin family peptidyl-prolyl cis-trans isomerase